MKNVANQSQFKYAEHVSKHRVPYRLDQLQLGVVFKVKPLPMASKQFSDNTSFMMLQSTLHDFCIMDLTTLSIITIDQESARKILVNAFAEEVTFGYTDLNTEPTVNVHLSNNYNPHFIIPQGGI